MHPFITFTKSITLTHIAYLLMKDGWLDACHKCQHCNAFMCAILSESFSDNNKWNMLHNVTDQCNKCSVAILSLVCSLSLYPIHPVPCYAILSASVCQTLGCHKLFKALYPLQLRCWVYHKYYLIQWEEKMEIITCLMPKLIRNEWWAP